MRDNEPTCQLNYHLKKYTIFNTSSTCYYLLLTVKRIILDFGKKKKKEKKKVYPQLKSSNVLNRNL